MQDKSIAVPASYFYYLENQNALDILDDQSTPPPSFSMDEVIKFCQAKASLAVCKYEYYVLLTDFFKATWGKALEQIGGIEPLKFGALSMTEHPLVSVDELWSESHFFWKYKITSKHTLWLGCTACEQYTHLGLMCAVEDGVNNWETNGEIRLDPKYWRQGPDENGNIVLLEPAELILIKGQAVDTGLLRQTAEQALKDIFVFCTNLSKA